MPEICRAISFGSLCGERCRVTNPRLSSAEQSRVAFEAGDDISIARGDVPDGPAWSAR